MKFFAAASVAALGGRCIDALSGPIVLEPTTTPECNITVTAAALANDCGTAANPCPAYRKALVSLKADYCGKTYRMGYKYPGEGEHRNATIYVKVVEVDATMPEDWKLSQEGWANFCPFQCSTSPTTGVCMEAIHNCTRNETVADYPSTTGTLQIPGSTKLPVTGLDLQWKAVDAGNNDNSADTSAVQDKERLRGTVNGIDLWDTNVVAKDKICPGYSFDLHNTIHRDPSCGFFSHTPCYVMSADACGTCRRLTISNGGYDESGSTATICKDGKCEATWRNMHVVTVVSEPGLGSHIQMAQKGWKDLCTHGCKSGSLEQCTSAENQCYSDAVTVKDTWPTHNEWGEFWRPGTMNFTRPLIVSSVEQCVSGATRVAVTSLVSVLLAMVVMFV